MNAGPAWRIEETAWDDGPPAIPELDTPSDVPASVTRTRRASVDTEPASDPFHAPSAERADWCVDMGELLLTMSNFELWTAIERSAVAPWMRVWREGMECWTPVQEVPELRWALASTPEWRLDLTRDEIDEELASGPIALAVNDGPEAARESAVGEEATPSEQGARALSRGSRGSLDDVTPAPMDTTPAPTAADCAPHRETRRGAGWLAGGSAVAAAAIAFALLRAAAHATPIESTRAAVAAEGPRAIATEASEATRAVEAARAIESARVIEAARAIESARAAESARAMKPAAPTRARREERGQRRLPRGGGRAQGR